jgi:hypothetical protein
MVPTVIARCARRGGHPVPAAAGGAATAAPPCAWPARARRKSRRPAASLCPFCGRPEPVPKSHTPQRRTEEEWVLLTLTQGCVWVWIARGGGITRRRLAARPASAARRAAGPARRRGALAVRRAAGERDKTATGRGAPRRRRGARPPGSRRPGAPRARRAAPLGARGAAGGAAPRGGGFRSLSRECGSHRCRSPAAPSTRAGRARAGAPRRAAPPGGNLTPTGAAIPAAESARGGTPRPRAPRGKWAGPGGGPLAGARAQPGRLELAAGDLLLELVHVPGGGLFWRGRCLGQWVSGATAAASQPRVGDCRRAAACTPALLRPSKQERPPFPSAWAPSPGARPQALT